MKRVFLTENEHSETFHVPIEVVQLAESMRHGVDELYVGKILGFGEFREGDFHAKVLAFSMFQEQIMHNSSTIIVVPSLLIPPFL